MNNRKWLAEHPEELVDLICIEYINCRCCIHSEDCYTDDYDCNDGIRAWLDAEHAESSESRAVPKMGQVPETDANASLESPTEAQDAIIRDFMALLNEHFREANLKDPSGMWESRAKSILARQIVLTERRCSDALNLHYGVRIAKLEAERDGWRRRCGMLLACASDIQAIADEWDEEE